ncbi:BLOC-1-related complex subunit 7 isoform X1 [Macrotis lagotis]|uniref:BLOC-1-related complex subunit 7 isoform X1 n=1 Tax=Macrotis lagotis TaxID=92651 RepID=UPI003D68535B
MRPGALLDSHCFSACLGSTGLPSRRGRSAAMAAGAPDAQSRFGQSVKGLLTEKVNACGTDVIALTKQVLKGSRSSELLGQAARNMVLQEDAILHSEDSLRKMAIITTHLQYQQEAIQKNVELSSNLQDQLKHLLK